MEPEVESTAASPVSVPENSPLYDFYQQEAQRKEPEQPNAEPGDMGGEGNEAGQQDQSYSFSLKPAWEQLEKDGISIPDDFKQGKFGEGVDEWSAFRQLVIENTEFEPDNEEPADEDAFIANYKRTAPDKRAEYIKTYNDSQEFFNLSADKKVESWYQSLVKKDANGNEVRQYDDKAIKDYIGKLTPIELDQKAAEIDGVARRQFDEYYNRGTEEHTQQSAERISSINKQRVEIAKTVAAEIDTMSDFSGVPLTPEQKLQAKRDFILLNQIDPTTGKPHLLGLLNDNKKLMRFVLASTMFGGDYINEYLSAQKENFKEILLNEKLDIAPKAKSGTIGKPSGGNLPLP